MIRPSSFVIASTGLISDRIQWPVSAHAPIRLLRPRQTLSTVSGFQHRDGLGVIVDVHINLVLFAGWPDVVKRVEVGFADDRLD